MPESIEVQGRYEFVRFEDEILVRVELLVDGEVIGEWIIADSEIDA